MKATAPLETGNCGIELESGHFLFVPCIAGYPPNSLLASPETVASMPKKLPFAFHIYSLSLEKRLTIALSVI